MLVLQLDLLACEMMSSSARFDLGRLFSEVDRERVDQALSWSDLALRVGVSASTIRRYGHAKDAEADGVLAMISWLQAAPEEFIAGGSVEGGKLPVSGDGFVRVDMERVRAAMGDVPSSHRGTRTTIQRLVDVATRSDRPVVSFTCVSDV